MITVMSDFCGIDEMLICTHDRCSIRNTRWCVKLTFITWTLASNRHLSQ